MQGKGFHQVITPVYIVRFFSFDLMYRCLLSRVQVAFVLLFSLMMECVQHGYREDFINFKHSFRSYRSRGYFYRVVGHLTGYSFRRLRRQ